MMTSMFVLLFCLLVPAVNAYEAYVLLGTTLVIKCTEYNCNCSIGKWTYFIDKKGHVQRRGFPSNEFEILQHKFSDPWMKYKAPFNDNGTATVDLQLSLNRIISLDTKTQVLTIDAWITVQYKDEFLSWTPEYFGDINSVRVPSDKIWKPDILLYNNAGMTNGYTAEVLSVLTYDGTIFYVQPVQLKSYCKTPRTVPNGSKITCSLKFGSWSYDGYSLDLKLAYGHNEVDLSNYDDEFNRDWKVVNTSATRNVMVYQCCPEPYVDLLYTFELQKQSL